MSFVVERGFRLGRLPARKNRLTSRPLTPGPGAQQLEQLAAEAASLRQAGAGSPLQPVDRLRDLRRKDERIAPRGVENLADGLVAQASAALSAEVSPTPYTLFLVREDATSPPGHPPPAN